jgi:hypothetical protein
MSAGQFILLAQALHHASAGRTCPLWVLAVSKRFAAEVWDEAGLRCELLFPAFDYARIAAISGWMPMMFITRVRL